MNYDLGNKHAILQGSQELDPHIFDSNDRMGSLYNATVSQL
jgi:hypothetical protein